MLVYTGREGGYSGVVGFMIQAANPAIAGDVHIKKQRNVDKKTLPLL